MKRTRNTPEAIEAFLCREGLSRKGIALFRRVIYEHYRQEQRSMPWRGTKNPYRVLVSEIMLQQTQVERVLEKYRLFIRTFPDFPALAAAKLGDVLKVWHGLGYNRRAVALKRIADIVQKEYDGRLPDSIEELLNLPGIGRYTASAIYTFAWNRPSLFIETNIRRVFIHFFFKDREKVRDEEIMPVLKKTLDERNPREWYYALMDYGVLLRKEVKNPNVRSAHYQRQSPFEGSVRQFRGKILSMLLLTPGMTEAGIRKTLPSSPVPLSRILEELQREGFIRKDGRVFVIS